MTAAAVVFCSVIAFAIAGGFGAPAFARVIASDAIAAAMPFLVAMLLARFAIRRFPAKQRLIDRVHASAQGLMAAMTFGWMWFEPHAILTQHTGSSLVAMGWLALLGAFAGLAIARVAERSEAPLVLRELLVGTWVLLVVGGGRLYREFDHVEAGARLAASLSIVIGTLAVALALWLLLRRRPRVAAAIPALAPAVAGLALLVASRSGDGAAELSSRESILVVFIDTLRADIADGRFQADPDAMPELERIAKNGVRFTQAVSPAPWTLPAAVSMLSGWNPHRHGFGATASDWEVLAGDPDALYLPAALRDAGYLPGAFLHNPYLRPWYGFDRGFYLLRPYHGRAVDGAALALDWLHGRAGMPTFTLLHMMDPHWPYDAPPGFGAVREECASCDSLFLTMYAAPDEKTRAEILRRYAAEVRYTDAMLGRFYGTLERAGALENTWLFIVSDHGEEFWEHGRFLHGHALYDELLRVPLVVVPPRASKTARRGVRVDAPVRLEDVGATLVEIAGLDPSLAPDGRSLAGLISGAADTAERTSVGGFVKSPDDFSWSVRRPPWKIMISPEIGMAGSRLFDLQKDPGEQTNYVYNATRTPLENFADGMTFHWLSAEPARLGLVVPRARAQSRLSAPEADTKNQLKSLGYAH